MRLLVIFIVIMMLTSCSSIDSFEITENINFPKVLIASESGKLNEEAINLTIPRLLQAGFNIKVIDIGDVKGEVAKDYAKVVLITSGSFGKPKPDARKYAEESPDRKIFMIIRNDGKMKYEFEYPYLIISEDEDPEKLSEAMYNNIT